MNFTEFNASHSKLLMWLFKKLKFPYILFFKYLNVNQSNHKYYKVILNEFHIRQ